MSKTKIIQVDKFAISLYTKEKEEYISLTDMARYRDADRTNYIIQNWMRTRNAIEFCGLWERLYNPNFKSIEFDAFKKMQGQTVLPSIPKSGLKQRIV
jgi:KilA-N domain